MKILHIDLQPGWRGGEQQLAYLMEELDKKDIEQWVLARPNSALEQYCREKHRNHFVINLNPLHFFIKGAGLLKKIVREKGIQIIHAHDSTGHSLVALACLSGLKTPVVVHRRVDFPVRKSFFSRIKYNLSCISHYICVSDKVKKVLQPSVKNNIPIEVVYSGIDINRFQNVERNNKLRSEYNLDENAILIGNISALADHKDLYTFVDTAFILCSRYEHLYFFLIGDGPERSGLESYIQSKSLNNRVFTTGFRSDIDEILPGLDIFLFTSKTEGLGTTVLDAMACGVPVVSTAAGGVPEIIRHHQNGLLAEIQNPASLAQLIEKLLTEPGLKKHLISQARKDVKSFSKESMADKIYQIYVRVLKNQL